MSTRIIPVILLIVILGVGFVAFSFYTDKQDLFSKNETLEESIAVLTEENRDLQDKYSRTEEERDDVARRLSMVQEEILRIETERDKWKEKYAVESREKNELTKKIKKSSRIELPGLGKTRTENTADNYWADFVEKKATLEAVVDNLKEILLDAKIKIAELNKDNKELSIRIDQLTKEKERFAKNVKFKEKTLRVMSMDLVNEREERNVAVTELKKLRSENVSLKREIITANKQKMKLQNELKKTTKRKDSLERKIMETESVLKDNFLAFEELQTQLDRVFTEEKNITDIEPRPVSVELPPIVINPDVSGLKGLKGEVIAVNREENFIVMDIGETSGLRPGTSLRVVRQDKEIATVEIIETRKEISAADIKEVTDGFILQEGDTVAVR